MSNEAGVSEVLISGQGEVAKAVPVVAQEPVAIKGVSMAVPEPVRDDPSLTPSNKPQFNPDAVQDARVDTNNDGGRTVAKATGDMSAVEIKSDLTSSLSQPGEFSNKFELYGFKAQYRVAENQVVASDVRVFFDKEADAKTSINGNRYVHAFPDGSSISCLIVSGAPRIAYADRERVIYTDGEWREAK